MRAASALVLVACLCVSTATSASADTDVAPLDSGFGIAGQKRSDGNNSSITPVGDDGNRLEYHERESCALTSKTTCYRFAQCPDGQKQIAYWYTDSITGETVSDGTYCPTDAAPPTQRLTAGMVAAAFRRIPLPESELVIQPPGGRTLVNFDTNFYTHDRTLHRTVRLLGRRVELRITVDTYAWHFESGSVRYTSGPGAAYPALLITHNYLKTGTYRPSLDTTYAADFRVGGGPWRAVNGTVTIAGTPTSLRAIEARPVLVDYRTGR